jgi:hypothetical protein
MAEVLISGISCPRCSGGGLGNTPTHQDQVYVDNSTSQGRCPNCGYTWAVSQAGNAMIVHVDYSGESFRPHLAVTGAVEGPSVGYVTGQGGFPPYVVSCPVPADLPAGLTIGTDGFANSNGAVTPGAYVIHVNVIDSMGFHTSSTVTVDVG